MNRVLHGARSFGTKIILSVTLTAGIAVVIVSALILIADAASTRREAIETLRSQAERTALDSGAPIVFGDSEHGTEVLNALRTAPEIASATLFDRDGNRFASFRRDFDAGPELSASPTGQREDGRWLILSQPVVDRGERQGQLQLVYDLRPIRARLWRNASIAALFALAAMLIAFLEARRIKGGLTVQIRELVDTATRVSESRDWSLRTRRLSDDELGNLAVAFNEMLSQIEEQKRDLEAAQAEREDLLASERAARAEAERASRMKDDFVATLSHELRTPLTPILGWVQILKRSGAVADPPTREGLEVIERNARLQARMIEDLLDMSRIISGKLQLDVSRVSLADVIEAAIGTVRHAAEVREIELLSALESDLGVVRGDPNRLQQVVWNLLSNAIKFTAKGGRVRISLARRSSQVEIAVSDTGQGIAPELLPYVFERFRQGDSSTTRQHRGLGLGLAIVRQLVEMHGGSVRAESDGPGQGSTFSVLLPLEPPDVQRSTDWREQTASFRIDPAPRESSVLEGLDVLVVDDEPDVRELVRRLLAQSGAGVRLASSSAEALQELGRARTDLLISDIGMPDADGYELIRRVREIERDLDFSTPAIALTAFARSEDRTRALRAGYNLHMAKPVEPAELVAAVATLSGRG